MTISRERPAKEIVQMSVSALRQSTCMCLAITYFSRCKPCAEGLREGTFNLCLYSDVLLVFQCYQVPTVTEIFHRTF